MGLDYVDIFYSHRPDPDTPLEETMRALDQAVRQGKALYVGISSYSAEQTAQAARILRELGTPCLIHQPLYSMFNRWVEDGLLDVLREEGIGGIAFCPLAQGLLTSKYLGGIPAGSRAATAHGALRPEHVTDEALAQVRALDAIARRRGQSLAQMALAWVLRNPEMEGMFVDDLILSSRGRLQAIIDDARLFGRDWGFRLSDVNPPVRWWHGDSDSIVHLAGAQAAIDWMPNAELILRPEESHLGGFATAQKGIRELDGPAHVADGCVHGSQGQTGRGIVTQGNSHRLQEVDCLAHVMNRCLPVQPQSGQLHPGQVLLLWSDLQCHAASNQLSPLGPLRPFVATKTNRRVRPPNVHNLRLRFF
jgi:hypothetical protein